MRADGFREILEGEGVEAVRLPPRSPNLNPQIERFIRSIKDERLSRMILFGEKMLRNAVRQFEMAPVLRTVRVLKVVGEGNVSWWFKVPVPLLCCSGWKGLHQR
jgi:transposase InsO family protein